MYTELLTPARWTQLQPTLRPLLEQALKHAASDWSYEALQVRVLSGDLLVFLATKDENSVSVAVGQFVYYPSHTTFLVTFAAGGIVGYEHVLDRICDFAQASGAQSVEAWCRPAVARLLRRFHFEHAFTVVRRSLRGE